LASNGAVRLSPFNGRRTPDEAIGIVYQNSGSSVAPHWHLK
jgi:hypothetical protein